MLSFRRSALLLAAAASVAPGQPALTTIQDILYRADGTRFNGTMFINYQSFQAGDTSNIATAHLQVPVVNGVLTVALVPTTTASAGAQYKITYNSQGINQFTEAWAVPPSSVVLKVRDVRVSQGTIIGPPPVTAPIQISDVTGLQNQLAIRTQEGIGFALGRAAVINTSGQIDGASGNLSDCVRVDGSSGPCGSGSGTSATFADNEVPSGTINGVNTTFTLASAPAPAASLDLYRNGLLMKQGVDYTLSANVVTFSVPQTPQTGDILLANYRFGGSGSGFAFPSPQVICSSTGNSTSATALTQLGSCTIPAGTLGAGDRIEAQFQYAHQGTSTAFTAEVHWGGTTAISRATGPGESAVSGRLDFGISSTGQAWNGESSGNLLSFAVANGSAGEDITQNLTISLFGQMAAATTDSVILRNFTVVRYPAQSHP